MKKLEERYLERLAELYPTIAAASTEVINLEAILNLPKGTEHFLTDVHGEYEAFSHVLKNGSGSVRRKIDDVFGHTLSRQDKQTLATLIYYPWEKMEWMRRRIRICPAGSALCRRRPLCWWEKTGRLRSLSTRPTSGSLRKSINKSVI